MWNLNYTIPTFAILLIFLVYYIARPRMSIRINQTFIWLLITDAATMVFNFISTAMDMVHWDYSITALYLTNTLFFVFFILRSYLFYLFTVDALNLRLSLDRVHILISFLVLGIAELSAILSPWFHILFSIDREGYHSGPLYNIIYVQLFYYILISIILLFLKGQNLSKIDYNSILTYNLILLAGAIIRYLNPHLVIMNLFCLLAIFIQFLSFQNPNNYIDKNTGLFNRNAFETMVGELQVTSKKRQMLGLVIKNYRNNIDLYGISQMNSGLASIAEYLKSEFGEHNLYYLRGGAFIIEGSKDIDFESAKEKIIRRFQQPWQGEKANLHLLPGFVIEKQMESFESVEWFMGCLQATLQQAAQMGTDTCLTIDKRRKDEWEREIRIIRAVNKAIAEERVEVFLQSIVSTEDFQIVGAEALARISDPEIGTIMPGEFIHLAEKNGSIIALGEQVMRKTCEFLAENRSILPLQWINVNLSPLQCLDRNLPMEFSRIANESGIPQSMIHLEITEEENLDWVQMNNQINELSRQGFYLVLDDYGIGFSNIERVKKLPLINVKIDMSIVRDHFKSHDTMLPLTVKMIKEMGFSSTAEGVETIDMAEELKSLGCSLLQGYYFSAPASMEDFVEIFCNRS